MTRRASFRSQLALGSVLWTLGLLIAVSVALIQWLGANPVSHREVFTWFWQASFPLVLGGAVVAMAAGVWQIRRSLTAMDLVRTELASLHRGDDRQLGGPYPAEIQPLVDEVNALLVQRDARVQRAIAKAGDLAHGLKTPLAVLARDAAHAAASGQDTLAVSMTEQIARMRRQIDYHLAQARASASGVAGARTVVLESVAALVRTLARLHGDRGVRFDVQVAADVAVRCQREDLDEMLGNLLDNACKWARRTIRVDAQSAGDTVTVLVDDDGPGLEPAVASSVLERGVRADETRAGSGLGLAIVRDLADIYGGSIALSRGPFGGLRATLVLPGDHVRPT